MLSKCANPECQNTLHYLREGKVFKVESESGAFLVGDKKPQRKVEHFWLCGTCSAALTVTYHKEAGIQVTRKPLVQRAAAS
jgi:hypothetical protein